MVNRYYHSAHCVKPHTNRKDQNFAKIWVANIQHFKMGRNLESDLFVSPPPPPPFNIMELCGYDVKHCHMNASHMFLFFQGNDIILQYSPRDTGISVVRVPILEVNNNCSGMFIMEVLVLVLSQI